MKNFQYIGLLSVFFFACGGAQNSGMETNSSDLSSSSPSVSKVPPVEIPSTPGLKESERDVYFSGKGDVDGDGEMDEISVTGLKLHVEDGSVALDSSVQKQIAANGTVDVKVKIVDFDRNTSEKHIAIFLVTDIDQRIGTWFFYDFQSSKVEAIGSAKGTELHFIDGTLHSEQYNCGERRFVEWGLREGKVAVVADKTMGKYNADDCAVQCPYVYAGRTEKTLEFQGEILRNLRNSSLETTQELALDSLENCSDKVWVTLTEEKPEVTYLDSVHLKVGNQLVKPTECDADAAYCSEDQNYFVLSYGESLRLSFEIPEGQACVKPTLSANGYYLPL